MRLKVTLCAVISLCVLSFGCHKANSSPRPLTKSELLALIAGETLPDNVVSEIRLNGLSFAPDDAYISLLKNTGVDPSILVALNGARQSAGADASSAPSNELLTHLSNAGKLIRAKHLDSAAEELTSALSSVAAAKNAAGFVMGDILIQQDRSEEAGRIYFAILEQDPGFPEVHTRLSLTCNYTGDPEEALRQAHAALARNPNNAPAHLNSGVALQAMRNFDAAKAEYLQAMRDKPDYELAYFDLGILLDNMRDYDGAIEQDRKAINLQPSDVSAHYNLGVAYGHKGAWTDAIREYREVKRLDPNNLEARQNLGSALLQQDPAAAITEFRELAVLAPDFQFCRVCLAAAFLQTGRLPDAEKEYLLAGKLDPADPHAHTGLGKVYETQKKICPGAK